LLNLQDTIRALRTGEERYNRAVRFWARIFGLNFAVGVVTGIPMEFQFGTNWAAFSQYAGGVIGQTLAMEGMFAFFLESALVGALVFGEKRLGQRNHFLAALGVAAGAGSQRTSSSSPMRLCSIRWGMG
jgi:cytochrome bd ubiquinol oxidase subunit I